MLSGATSNNGLNLGIEERKGEGHQVEENHDSNKDVSVPERGTDLSSSGAPRARSVVSGETKPGTHQLDPLGPWDTGRDPHQLDPLEPWDTGRDPAIPEVLSPLGTNGHVNCDASVMSHTIDMQHVLSHTSNTNVSNATSEARQTNMRNDIPHSATPPANPLPDSNDANGMPEDSTSSSHVEPAINTTTNRGRSPATDHATPVSRTMLLDFGLPNDLASDEDEEVYVAATDPELRQVLTTARLMLPTSTEAVALAPPQHQLLSPSTNANAPGNEGGATAPPYSITASERSLEDSSPFAAWGPQRNQIEYITFTSQSGRSFPESCSVDPSDLTGLSSATPNEDTLADSLVATQLSDEEKHWLLQTGRPPISVVDNTHNRIAGRQQNINTQSAENERSGPLDLQTKSSPIEPNIPDDYARGSQSSSEFEQQKAVELFTSAENDFKSLSSKDSSGPVLSLRERTEEDADALLDEIISGKSDKTMGPNCVTGSLESSVSNTDQQATLCHLDDSEGSKVCTLEKCCTPVLFSTQVSEEVEGGSGTTAVLSSDGRENAANEEGREDLKRCVEDCGKYEEFLTPSGSPSNSHTSERDSQANARDSSHDETQIQACSVPKPTPYPRREDGDILQTSGPNVVVHSPAVEEQLPANSFNKDSDYLSAELPLTGGDVAMSIDLQCQLNANLEAGKDDTFNDCPMFEGEENIDSSELKDLNATPMASCQDHRTIGDFCGHEVAKSSSTLSVVALDPNEVCVPGEYRLQHLDGRPMVDTVPLKSAPDISCAEAILSWEPERKADLCQKSDNQVETYRGGERKVLYDMDEEEGNTGEDGKGADSVFTLEVKENDQFADVRECNAYEPCCSQKMCRYERPNTPGQFQLQNPTESAQKTHSTTSSGEEIEETSFPKSDISPPAIPCFVPDTIETQEAREFPNNDVSEWEGNTDLAEPAPKTPECMGCEKWTCQLTGIRQSDSLQQRVPLWIDVEDEEVKDDKMGDENITDRYTPEIQSSIDSKHQGNDPQDSEGVESMDIGDRNNQVMSDLAQAIIADVSDTVKIIQCDYRGQDELRKGEIGEAEVEHTKLGDAINEDTADVKSSDAGSGDLKANEIDDRAQSEKLAGGTSGPNADLAFLGGETNAMDKDNSEKTEIPPLDDAQIVVDTLQEDECSFSISDYVVIESNIEVESDVDIETKVEIDSAVDIERNADIGTKNVIERLVGIDTNTALESAVGVESNVDFDSNVDFETGIDSHAGIETKVDIENDDIEIKDDIWISDGIGTNVDIESSVFKMDYVGTDTSVDKLDAVGVEASFAKRDVDMEATVAKREDVDMETRDDVEAVDFKLELNNDSQIDAAAETETKVAMDTIVDIVTGTDVRYMVNADSIVAMETNVDGDTTCVTSGPHRDVEEEPHCKDVVICLQPEEDAVKLSGNLERAALVEDSISYDRQSSELETSTRALEDRERAQIEGEFDWFNKLTGDTQRLGDNLLDNAGCYCQELSLESQTDHDFDLAAMLTADSRDVETDQQSAKQVEAESERQVETDKESEKQVETDEESEKQVETQESETQAETDKESEKQVETDEESEKQVETEESETQVETDESEEHVDLSSHKHPTNAENDDNESEKQAKFSDDKHQKKDDNILEGDEMATYKKGEIQESISCRDVVEGQFDQHEVTRLEEGYSLDIQSVQECNGNPGIEPELSHSGQVTNQCCLPDVNEACFLNNERCYDQPGTLNNFSPKFTENEALTESCPKSTENDLPLPRAESKVSNHASSSDSDERGSRCHVDLDDLCQPTCADSGCEINTCPLQDKGGIEFIKESSSGQSSDSLFEANTSRNFTENTDVKDDGIRSDSHRNLPTSNKLSDTAHELLHEETKTALENGNEQVPSENNLEPILCDATDPQPPDENLQAGSADLNCPYPTGLEAHSSGYDMTPVAKVILHATDQWLNKISDFCKSSEVTINDPDQKQLQEFAAQCKSEILAIASQNSDTFSNINPSPSRSCPHDIGCKDPNDTTEMNGCVTEARDIDPSPPAIASDKIIAPVPQNVLVPRPPSSQRASPFCRPIPFTRKLGQDEKVKVSNMKINRAKMLMSSLGDRSSPQSMTSRGQGVKTGHAKGLNDDSLKPKLMLNCALLSAITPSLSALKGQTDTDKTSSAKTADRTELAENLTPAYSLAHCKPQRSGQTGDNLGSQSAETPRLCSLPAANQNDAWDVGAGSTHEGVPACASTSKTKSTIMSLSTQTNLPPNQIRGRFQAGTSAREKERSLYHTGTRTSSDKAKSQDLAQSTSKKMVSEPGSPSPKLKRQKIQPFKMAPVVKPKPSNVMSMKEFERAQADRHLFQAFARIHSSKAYVDCHMDSKVMERTGQSARRRRERVNYNCLIALENVKFLELLRYQQSTYNREQQLKEFKKSCQTMVKLGKHPENWAELKEVEKKGAELRMIDNGCLHKTCYQDGRSDLNQAAGFA